MTETRRRLRAEAHPDLKDLQYAHRWLRLGQWNNQLTGGIMDKQLTKAGTERKRAPGAGRPPKFGADVATDHIGAWLPQSWIDELVAEFGSKSDAIVALAHKHMEPILEQML